MPDPTLDSLPVDALVVLLHDHAARFEVRDPDDGVPHRDRLVLVTGIQERLAAHGRFPGADDFGVRGYWPFWIAKALRGPCPHCGQRKVIRRRNDPDLRPATWSCDRCWRDRVNDQVTAAHQAARAGAQWEVVEVAIAFDRRRVAEHLLTHGVDPDIVDGIHFLPM